MICGSRWRNSNHIYIGRAHSKDSLECAFLLHGKGNLQGRRGAFACSQGISTLYKIKTRIVVCPLIKNRRAYTLLLLIIIIIIIYIDI